MVSSLPTTPTPATAELVPGFKIQMGGQPLKPEVVAVTVTEEIGIPSMFTLQLTNWDPKQLDWIDPNQQLELGNEVEISMGYKGHQTLLLQGEITGLEPEFHHGEVPILTVRGYDLSHRLLRGHKTRSFAHKTDSDIAREIAQGVKLMFQGTDTGISLDYVLQHNQTDMEFLQSRARPLGYEIIVRDNTLYFQPAQNQEDPSLTLSQTADLLMFQQRLTSLTQVGEIDVRGWDPLAKEPLIGQTQSQDRATGTAVVDKAFDTETTGRWARPLVNQAEADQIAQGRFAQMALAYIKGEGLCWGRADLRAGTVIELEGIGQRFSGPYYVTATTHSYTPKRGYRTQFTVQRNATS